MMFKSHSLLALMVLSIGSVAFAQFEESDPGKPLVGRHMLGLGVESGLYTKLNLLEGPQGSIIKKGIAFE